MLLAKALQNAAKLIKTPAFARGFAMQTKNEVLSHTFSISTLF